jgi:HPt (histidine-containing phosphotransfer) domain-containing protein
MSAGDVRWNAAQTLERLGGDQQLFHEVIEIFLREAPKQMANMHEALARGDKDATERIAHTLKGELGYLGVSEASHIASELENAGRNGDLARAGKIQILLEKDVETIVNTMRGVLAKTPTGLSQVKASVKSAGAD